MAHVHGTSAHHASSHAAMTHSAHGGHATGGMAHHPAHSGHQMSQVTRHATAIAASGATAAAASHTRRSLMSILSRHPLLVFGAGLAVGYLVHKYRKEIIQSATLVTEKGKDFVLHQRENLEDLVAECKECQDDSASGVQDS